MNDLSPDRSLRAILAFLAAALGSAFASAQSLTAPVLLPGDTTPAPAAGMQEDVDLARGATNYLAVWSDARTSLTGSVASVDGLNPNTDIYAAVLDDFGVPVPGMTSVINQDTWDQRLPQVAWNGQNYLVVWESTRPTQFWKTDGIFAARVSPTGQVLDDPPIVIDDTDDQDEHYPLVSSDGTNWMVLWTDYAGGGSDFIAGALVNPAGQVIQKQVVHQPSSQSFVPRNYDLDFCTDRYLFVYERGWGGNATGLFIDSALNSIGAPKVFSSGIGYRPGVGASANEFFVAWMSPGVQNTGDVRGTPVSLAGTPTVTSGAVLSLPNSTWSSSAAAAVDWDGATWTVAWENFDFANGQSLQGAQVAQNGTLFPGSPFTIVASSSQILRPSVAGGGGSAIVAWGDGRNTAQGTLERDIYGVSVGSGPVFGVQTAVASTPPAQSHPVLVEGPPGEFLVVFQSETALSRRVLAQRVNVYGAAIDAQPIEIASGNFLLREHDAAWNGVEWLIVWEQRLNTGSLLPARVMGRRMFGDGTLLDATPLDILPGNWPAVAALGSDFLVVSSEEPTDHVRWVRVQRVDAAGLLQGPMNSLSGGYEQSPDVIGLTDRWLVAWHGRASHDSPFATIYGGHVFPNDTTGLVFVMENAATSSNFSPTLSVGAGVGLLAWSADGDVRGRLLGLDGSLLGIDAGFPISTSPSSQFGPVAGWSGEGFVVAFDDHRQQTGIQPGVGDVYAGRVSIAGEALDFNEDIPIGSHFQGVEANPAVAGRSGLVLTAHSAVQLDTTYGTLRIVLRTLIAGVAEPFCFGDGGAATCPCGNNAPTGGCANSTGQGVVLTADGSPSVQQDDLVFTASGLPAQVPTLLFLGTAGETSPVLLADGLRCAGGVIDRLAVVTSTVGGGAAWGPNLGASAGWSGGQTLHFQAWYRDLAGPCSAGSNLSNGLKVVLVP